MGIVDMKTPEDEAFEEIERRQGGGFPAKRAMAADKLQEEDWGALAEKQLASIKRDTQASFEDAMVRATHKVMTELEAQPAQEPIAYVTGTYNGRFVVAPLNPAMVLPVGMAFYTTPPKRPWVGLTDEETQAYWDWEDWQTGAGRSTIFEMVRDIEAKLKEKNT